MTDQQDVRAAIADRGPKPPRGLTPPRSGWGGRPSAPPHAGEWTLGWSDQEADQPNTVMTTGVSVAVETTSPSARSRGIPRVLRPLRALVLPRPGRGTDGADDVARQEPARHAPPQRRPDEDPALVLLVDGSAAAERAGALQALLERQGCFRSIRVCLWGPPEPPAESPTPLDGKHGEGNTEPPRTPGEPAARCVALVLTDGENPAWSDGVAARLLARWAWRGPVAVVREPSVGEIPAPRVRLRSTGRYGAGGALGLRPVAADVSGAVLSGALAVPVLPPDPRRIRRWVDLVAGVSSGWMDTAVLLLGTGDGSVPPSTGAEPGDTEPDDDAVGPAPTADDLGA